ncbi:hypothetical protein L2Q67_004714, partial [Salmonella enterica]|nr:hypothetical protein [Salmonella enterica]
PATPATPPKRRSTTKKKTPTRVNKKEVQQKEVAEQLTFLIKTTFDIASLRMGQMWALSQEEASKLATPISNIMARHNLTEKMGEYGDYISLAVTGAMVFVPRFMMWQQMKQMEMHHLQIQKERVEHNATPIQKRETTKPTGHDSIGNQPPTDFTSDSKKLLVNAIPPM